MSRFTTFLNENVPILNYKKLQEYLLDGGTISFIDMMIAGLVDIQKHILGYSEKASKNSTHDFTKNLNPIIFGKDPTTKQWFVGTSLKNVYFSNKDILDSNGGQSAEVLKYALRFLPDLHIGGVIEVVVLYIKPDIKVEKEELIFTDPSGIKHVIPKESSVFETIKNSSIGIQVTGKYEGHDIRSLQKHPQYIPNIKATRSIWLAPETLPDHSGTITFTASETQQFKTLLEEVVNLRKNLTTSFLGQGKTLGLFQAMKEFNSIGNTPSTPNAYIVAFSDWAKQGHVKDLDQRDHIKLKAVKEKVFDMINFLNRNQTFFRAFLNLYFTVGKLEALLAGKIDAIQKMDKGLAVADRTAGHVKYVERSLYKF